MTDEIDLKPDVLVVGGGIAGLIAAARAKEKGAKVVILQRGGGASCSWSGAVDAADELIGIAPSSSSDPFERGGRWRRSADLVAARHHRHPYAVLGDKGRERLREGVALLKQLAHDGGVDYVERDDGQNHVLATQLGTIKRCALAQKAQILDVAQLEGETLIGVVEPLDLAGFGARPVAHTLSWIAGLGKKKAQFVSVVLERALPGKQVHDGTLAMAHALDDDNLRAAFAEQLRAAMRKTTRPPTQLLVPPIMGVEKTAAILQELERAAGRPVRELLAFTPSAPAERAIRALTAAVRRRGAIVVDAHATAARVVDRKAESITIESNDLRVDVRPKAVVLATGRFLGGGIVRNHHASEALFGLPVIANGARVDDSFIGDHLAMTPEGEHAIFRAGVAIDHDLRPLDGRGDVAIENVACAGTVIEGYDPARDGTAAAVAAWTGLLAGERAAAMAKG